MKHPPRICTVIPNLNGALYIRESIQSLKDQSTPTDIVVVDDLSSDDSVSVVESIPEVKLIKNKNNLGFAGAVNVGIRDAIANNYKYIALFNNDAVAEKDWLKNMLTALEKDARIGITTCLFLNQDGTKIDSTGEMYSTWLLPFPRHRGKNPKEVTLAPGYILAASGGASLYKSELFNNVGLFDEDFFAYYEDVELSLRAQRSGWKVWFEPTAVAYHRIGATSSKLKGFTVYQSAKNTPLVWIKSLPLGLIIKYSPRFWLAYTMLMINQCAQGNSVYVLRGFGKMLVLFPQKLIERKRMPPAKVSSEYIESLLFPGIPPDRAKLKRLFNKGLGGVK